MPVVATAAPARSATVVFNMMFVDVGCGGGVDLVLILFDFMLYIYEGKNPFNCILQSGIHALYFKTNSHVLSDDYISDPLQRFFIMLLCSTALHCIRRNRSIDRWILYSHCIAMLLRFIKNFFFWVVGIERKNNYYLEKTLFFF